MAKNVMEQLRAHGKVIRGYLGLLLQSLTPDLAKGLGLEATKGVLVGDVVQGGPADQAGFRRGDVITEFNGQPADSVIQLRNMVASMKPGTEVDVRVIRKGQEKTLHATLGEQPQKGQPSGAEGGGPPSPEQLGLVVQTLTPDIAQQLGYQGDRGAVIVQVQAGSAAESAGLQRGDLIKEVNRQEVGTARELASKLHGLKSGDTAALLVRRGGDTFFVPIQIP
jgi:serine protease Do